jgi:glutamyl-tRNA reductase
VDVAVAAAAAPGYLVTPDRLAAALAARTAPLVLVDLAVPRVVDPALGEHPLVRLVGVDDLAAVAAGHRARHGAEVAKADAMVEAAIESFDAWLATRGAAPTIAALRRRAEAVRAEEFESALRKLGHLSDRDRNVVAALSVGLVNKLLHGPVTELRQGADRDALDHARRLFGLERSAPVPSGDDLTDAVAIDDAALPPPAAALARAGADGHDEKG